MFSIIGNQLTCCCQTGGNCQKAVVSISQLLDLAGAITLIALGALALTGQGGEVIATLNTVPRGPWVMMLAGLATLGVAYLFKPIDHNVIKATVTEVLNQRERI